MRTLLIVALITIGPAATAQAQSQPEAENSIREQIKKHDALSSGALRQLGTDDVVFWSGAYPKPSVGKKSLTSPTGGQRTSQSISTEVVRIEVAKSGDLAYEFSNFRIKAETKAEGKFEFLGSLLRVWRNENNEWRIAAQFMRPHEEEKK